MSEPVVTSDKVKRRSRDIVRTWCGFRQSEEEKLRICPNLVWLQTKLRWVFEKLSEPGMTSDKMKRRS